MYIVALCRTSNECTQTYVNVLLHTTMYSICVHICSTLYDNVRQCSTKNTSLRQYFCRTQKFHTVRQCTAMFDKNYFPTTVFLSYPKVLHVKLFFIRSIAYEILRFTANNRDNPRQPTINLSHLKSRMCETSIRVKNFLANLIDISVFDEF